MGCKIVDALVTSSQELSACLAERGICKVNTYPKGVEPRCSTRVQRLRHDACRLSPVCTSMACAVTEFEDGQLQAQGKGNECDFDSYRQQSFAYR